MKVLILATLLLNVIPSSGNSQTLFKKDFLIASKQYSASKNHADENSGAIFYQNPLRYTSGMNQEEISPENSRKNQTEKNWVIDIDREQGKIVLLCKQDLKGQVNIQLMDLFGKSYFQNNLDLSQQSKLTIPIQKLPAGEYLIWIKSPNGKHTTDRFVID